MRECGSCDWKDVSYFLLFIEFPEMCVCVFQKLVSIFAVTVH